MTSRSRFKVKLTIQTKSEGRKQLYKYNKILNIKIQRKSSSESINKKSACGLMVIRHSHVVSRYERNMI